MESLKRFTQGFIWKLMEWGDSCLAFSCLRLREIFLQKLLYKFLPSLQTISFERVQPPLGFSSQAKWEQTKPHCILRHTWNFHNIVDFYISSKVCVRVFIWQTMKQISLNQLNQGMRIYDVVNLNFWSRDACKELRHDRARIVFKSQPSWLIFNHDMCFRRTNFGFS